MPCSRRLSIKVYNAELDGCNRSTLLETKEMEQVSRSNKLAHAATGLKGFDAEASASQSAKSIISRANKTDVAEEERDNHQLRLAIKHLADVETHIHSEHILSEGLRKGLARAFFSLEAALENAKVSELFTPCPAARYLSAPSLATIAEHSIRDTSPRSLRCVAACRARAPSRGNGILEGPVQPDV